MYITEQFVKSAIPKRAPESHKGNFGSVLLLCGSVGYTGAAAMAANAAVRSGAGLVFLGTPEPVYPILAGKLDEPMVFPLPADEGKLSPLAKSDILLRLSRADAVLVGPGLGISPGVRECVMTVLEESKVPVVLDADGINVLQDHIYALRDSACPVIVTPHPGEFLRLGGRLDSQSREDAAAQLARELGCICVLKGHNTVVTDGTEILVNTTGNPGMATGGSGDVLAGILVSFLGQGMTGLTAAAAAVYVHGCAGDLCAEQTGQYGMTPTDMIRMLPRILP